MLVNKGNNGRNLAHRIMTLVAIDVSKRVSPEREQYSMYGLLETGTNNINK